MKKLVVFAILVLLIFAGCSETIYTVTIKNEIETNKTVSYTYNGVSKTLPINNEETYSVNAYNLPPTDLKDEHDIYSVKLTADGITGNYTFKEAEFYNLIVTNKLAEDIKITAGKYTEYTAKYNSIEIPIAKNTTEVDTEVKIYTKNPIFTSSTGNLDLSNWKLSGDNIILTIDWQ